MVRLADYLEYLYQQVVEARKNADIRSIALAKEYAEDEYLQHFSVPRFSMPKVTLNVPIRITDIDSSVKYDYKRDSASLRNQLNTEIQKVNAQRSLNIPLLKEDPKTLASIKKLEDQLEHTDQRFVKDKGLVLDKVDFNVGSKLFFKGPQTATRSQEEQAFSDVLRQVTMARFQPKTSDLQNIFINPESSKSDAHSPLLVHLEVEMVDEGIRIRRFQDGDGTTKEELVFE